MNKEEYEIVKRFVSDTYTSELVFDTLRKGFLKDDGVKDVHHLAAKTIAINLLEKGISEMKRTQRTSVDTGKIQVGI